MDRRSKILAWTFGTLVALAFLWNVVYPAIEDRYLTLPDQIARLRGKLGKLEKGEDEVRRAKEAYKALLARVGSFDTGSVDIDVRSRLNELIEKHDFVEASVSRARTSKFLKKADVERVMITLSATARLEAAMGFLKDIAEMPDVIRVGNVKLSPAGSRRKNRRVDRMNVTIPIELLVLPRHKLVGRVKLSDLQRPDSVVRHQGRDYAPLWEREPFSEYKPPDPLVVTAPSRLTVNVGDATTLQATGRGGEAPYSYRWSPPEGLDNTDAQRPRFSDSQVPRSHRYTVTVTDARGESAEAVVTVTVKEPAKTHVADAPPPEPTPPLGWPERANMQLRMTLRTWSGLTRLDEAMVHNERKKETSYYKVGDEFDGGTLVFVHQTGVLVRRQSEYRVVPTGAMLDRDIAVASAFDFPTLKEAARIIRQAQEAARATPAVPDAAATATGEEAADTAAQPNEAGAPAGTDAAAKADGVKEAAGKPKGKPAEKDEEPKKNGKD